MENVSTNEQLLEFIRKNNIKSISDIYESLKDLFKDVLQIFLEAKIEETLWVMKNMILRTNNPLTLETDILRRL